ncbi:hypothetical protein PGTUg99_018228 [Puccinia graminis f. sp. tritici]|uniref:Uncharacterized protein n=1 Tax=Puccinia graminis f. sp. tritici TaxID=56615 RepID=A0A5B0QKH7_PUCGR|nr:hypothetical protein PGTUg99_018228 [Puccinia graminis f. sp. tritici]
MRALWAHPAEAHHIFLSAKIRGARTGDDNQSCKPWSGLARFPSEGMVKGWRTDRPCSPISFTQRWKVLLGERNLIDNVGGKEATHRQSNGPANRAPTEPFSQPGRMVWTTVHKRSYNMAVRPLWSTPSSNQWVVRLDDSTVKIKSEEGVDKRKPTPLAHAIAEWRAGRQATCLQGVYPAGGDSLLVGGTTLPAQEGILLVDEVVRPRRPRRESSWSARSYNLVDQEGILLAGDNLAGQEDSLLGRRGCTVNQEGILLVDEVCTTFYNLVDQEDSLLVDGTASPAQEGILLVDEPRQPRRESSWSARLYSLADPSLLAGENLAGQEDSLLGRRGCTVDQEGVLPVNQEDSLLGRRGCTADQEGILLARGLYN